MRLIKEKDGLTIDGVPHIKPQLTIHAVVTLGLSLYLWFLARGDVSLMHGWGHWLTTANLYALGGMSIFWFVSEFLQERAMVKAGKHVKNRHWKFWTWSQSRWQDMLFPISAGALYTAAVFAAVRAFL